MDWFGSTSNGLTMRPRSVYVYPEVVTQNVEQFMLVAFDNTDLRRDTFGADVAVTMNGRHPFNFCLPHIGQLKDAAAATGAIDVDVLPTDGEFFILSDGVQHPIKFVFLDDITDVLGVHELPVSIEVSTTLTRDEVTIAINASGLAVTATDNGGDGNVTDLVNDVTGGHGNLLIVQNETSPIGTLVLAGMTTGSDTQGALFWGIAQESRLVGQKCKVLIRGITRARAVDTGGGTPEFMEFGKLEASANQFVVKASYSALQTAASEIPDAANNPYLILARTMNIGTSGTTLADTTVLFDGIWGMGLIWAD